MIILIMENRGRPLSLSLFLCSDELADRDEWNAMDQILEVNRRK